MAGSDARFNAAQFRSAIKFAMNMGAPDSTSQRVTFTWTRENTWDDAQADAGGSPFEWDATPVGTSQPSPVQVDCAVNFSAASDITSGNPVGAFQNRRGSLIVLDSDWPSLTVGGRFTDRVEIDGDLYVIRYVNVLGLFEVTVYEIFIEALDES